MNLIYIIIGIIILAIIWLIPTVIITLITKQLTKKKLSKGWCMFIAVIALFVGVIFESLLIGVHTPGTLDMIVRFSCLSIIFLVLYDKDLPSIFDTEKEIKRKRELNKK